MKKSKILLTLVVVVLLCSLVFAFAGCNNDPVTPGPNDGGNTDNGGNNDDSNAEDEAEKEALEELRLENLSKWTDAITRALNFYEKDAEGNVVLDDKNKPVPAKKVGFEYAVAVPTVTTVDDKQVPMDVKFSVKGQLDSVTVNNNKMEIAAWKKVSPATTYSEVFVLQANEKDVLLRYVDSANATVVRKFSGLELGTMLNGAVLPQEFGSNFSMVLNLVLGLIDNEDYPTAVTVTDAANGTKDVQVAVNMSQLGKIIVGFVRGLDKSGTLEKHLGNTFAGLTEDAAKFIGSIKPVFNTNVDVDAKGNFVKFNKFNLDIDTMWGPAHLAITPKFDSDVVPTFETIDAKGAKETNLLNFSLNGEYGMNNSVYAYDIKADIDLQSVVKNLVVNENARAAAQREIDAYNKENPNNKKDPAKLVIANIFNGTSTKLLVDVKKDGANMFTLGMDGKALGDKLYIWYDADAILPGAFADVVFPDNGLAKGQQLIVLSPEELITGYQNKPTDKGVDESKFPAGPELKVEEPSNDKYNAAMKLPENNNKPAGKVYWAAVSGAVSYDVYVNDVLVKDDTKDTFVSVTSGQVVKVQATIAVKDADGNTVNKQSKTSKITYIDGRATAKAVAKAISMLTAIDYDYATDSVVINPALVKDFVAALNLAVEVKVGASDLNDLFNMFTLGSKNITVNVKGGAFFVDANHTLDVAAALQAVTSKDAAALKAVPTFNPFVA